MAGLDGGDMLQLYRVSVLGVDDASRNAVTQTLLDGNRHRRCGFASSDNDNLSQNVQIVAVIAAAEEIRIYVQGVENTTAGVSRRDSLLEYFARVLATAFSAVAGHYTLQAGNKRGSILPHQADDLTGDAELAAVCGHDDGIE